MTKKYKIGYTSGAFDLFHIGHLNILRRAKHQCDYLIVGLYTDDCIKDYKNIETVCDTHSRAELLKAIRYVDEVSIRESRDKKEAYDELSFEAIFIGDDWENTPEWNLHEEEMKKFGVDIIYLPYTQGISTTDIKKKINGDYNK